MIRYGCDPLLQISRVYHLIALFGPPLRGSVVQTRCRDLQMALDVSFLLPTQLPTRQQTHYPVDDRGRLELSLGLQDDCFIF
jgi:hypothetical protein